MSNKGSKFRLFVQNTLCVCHKIVQGHCGSVVHSTYSMQRESADPLHDPSISYPGFLPVFIRLCQLGH